MHAIRRPFTDHNSSHEHEVLKVLMMEEEVIHLYVATSTYAILPDYLQARQETSSFPAEDLQFPTLGLWAWWAKLAYQVMLTICGCL